MIPKNCTGEECPLSNDDLIATICDKSRYDMETDESTPGSGCPWVLLAAKNAEIERLRRRAREISEDFVPQHESEVALALDEMREEIAALAEMPDANPHTCPECDWQCACSDQPCSCCNGSSAALAEGGD